MKLSLGLRGTAPRAWRRLFATGILLASSSVMGCDNSEPLDEEDMSPEELEAWGDGKLDITDFFPWIRRDGGIPVRDAGSVKDGGTTCEVDAGGPTTPDASTPKPDASTPKPDASTPKPDASTPKPDAGGGTKSPWCDVQPIFEKSCAGCHDGQGSAGTPMGLVDHDDFLAASPYAPTKKVFEAVASRMHDSARPMPPRGLLPAADLAKVDAWVKAGAPGGDCSVTEPTDPGHENPGGHEEEPGGPNTNDGWDESKCDAVYKVLSHAPNSTGPFSVPAGQEIHPQVAIPAPWGNEKVQAIAFRPITDNKKVLHHWILYGGGGLSRAFLVGWAPGDEARPPYPADVGMEMPNTLTLDMHYYNTGAGAKTEADQSGVEICVLKQAHFRPKSAAVSMSFMSIGAGGVLAPRGANNTPQTGTCNVTGTTPVHLISAAPHAHKYARRMRFVVKKKNGKEIVMHDQPFLFGEQGTYALEGGEVVLEQGDVVTTTCYYTNETNKDIRFGESTESEMCFNFAAYWPKGALQCGGGLGGIFGN